MGILRMLRRIREGNEDKLAQSYTSGSLLPLIKTCGRKRMAK